ncbi:hypothetical protein TH53_10090 [Pedobacter lusitanus]|uniref:HTH araC/xylS-type domain-containing protein n=1 Tax=Pedobacter lusitanus TaxID=1503925 RepID=A0A0D0GM69_9SPHI|nr:helix-turn-helix domain-containing protein [Pedobacter lusitanus]KIO77285.1 hypothetical protein TH53_10090 [Pedobacter lusitanus]
MLTKKNILTDVAPFGYLGQDGRYTTVFNDLLLAEIRINCPEKVSFKAESYSIILCVEGHCIKTIEPHTFEVPSHSVHISRPKYNQVISDASADFRCLSITFTPSFYLDTPVSASIIEQLLIMNPDLPPLFKLSADDFEMVCDSFNRINTEYQLNTTFSKHIILNQLLELLYRVNRLCTEKIALPDSAFPRNEQLVRAYKRLIDKHFFTLKTVKEYADILKVSPKYLGEVIKTETGQTALPMIHYRIIQEARHLLKYTTQTIKEISYVLNFENIAHFSRFFKKYSGISPSDFRKTEEQNPDVLPGQLTSSVQP